jgi:hypothetical protein
MRVAVNVVVVVAIGYFVDDVFVTVVDVVWMYLLLLSLQ